MKPNAPEVTDGQSAFERFRRAMKTIVAVPKSRVLAREKAQHKKRRKVEPKS